MMAMPTTLADASESYTQEFAFGDREFDVIAGIVHEHTGIVLGRHKKTMAYSRLVRRLRALGMTSFKDYCSHVRSNEGAEEIRALTNAITTNLTRFFREGHHFEHLRDTALPEAIRTRQAARRLRIWSAACSTGEEPYSIAMTIAGDARLAGWDARILATDLDTSVLKAASEAVYPAGSVENVPSHLRKIHLRERPDGSSQIDPRLRSLVTLNQLNLLGEWPMKGAFDAIFCRNVMIYFDGPTKQRLVERLAEKLRDGGWLYIGHSETLLNHHPNLRLVGRTIYQKVGDA